jgi:hypothetical protein
VRDDHLPSEFDRLCSGVMEAGWREDSSSYFPVLLLPSSISIMTGITHPVESVRSAGAKRASERREGAVEIIIEQNLLRGRRGGGEREEDKIQAQKEW